MGAVIGEVIGVDVDFSLITRLEALQRLADTLNVNFRINDDRSVDLGTTGSDTPSEIRYRKNLRSIQRTIDEAEVVNRVIPLGILDPPGTVSGREWTVNTINGNKVIVQEPKAISSNDSFKGQFVQFVSGSLATDPTWSTPDRSWTPNTNLNSGESATNSAGALSTNEEYRVTYSIDGSGTVKVFVDKGDGQGFILKDSRSF